MTVLTLVSNCAFQRSNRICGHVYFVSAALPYGRSVHGKVLDWPKVGPGSAQSRPKVSPKSAQSRPKVGSKSAQSWPKVGPSRPKVGPKSAQSRPEVGPKWTQSWPKSAQSQPTVGPKSTPNQNRKVRISTSGPVAKIPDGPDGSAVKS